MNIMVDLGHPAQVHFYRHFVAKMRGRGHRVLITARDKDVALQLLQAYRMEHLVVGKIGSSRLGLLKEWMDRDRRLWSLAQAFHPDVLTALHSPCVAHVSRLVGARSVVFSDTEYSPMAGAITYPFAHTICTSTSFKLNLGPKQVRYDGYKELTYLHPDHFKPDHSVLEELGLAPGERFVVLRFVSWRASHDAGKHGIDLKAKMEMVERLSRYAKVFITSESALPEELRRHCLTTPPDKIHDVLHFASLFLGEGGTMATEAAVLGTPAIFVSPFARRLGTHVELEDKYQLLLSYVEPQAAMDMAVQLLEQTGSKNTWEQRRDVMLNDKIDVTQFMVEMCEKNGAHGNNAIHPVQLARRASADFTLEKYKELCSSALAAGFEFRTVSSWIRDPRSTGKALISRHDIDRMPGNALKMATLEYSLGIRSTYYFRMTKSVFKPWIIRAIAAMGHEVGYHYEVLDKSKGDQDLAISIFQTELSRLREFAPVETICMHGNPLTKWTNRDMWEKADFRTFGLIGEAYLSITGFDYLSDTGRRWDDGSKIKDFLPGHAEARERGEAAGPSSTNGIISLFNGGQVDRAYMVVHPERWSSNPAGWTTNLARDTAFNMVKWAWNVRRKGTR